MHLGDDIKIETPEQIEVSLEIAGLGSRFVAKVLDWCIKFMVLLGVGLLFLLAALLLSMHLPDGPAAWFLLVFVLVLFYAFVLAFDIYYEVNHNGQSPGKKITGIRVLREGGAPLDFQASCIRNLLSLADFLPMFYLLGGFIALLNTRGQRLGDMAAGTVVVRERAMKPPVHVDWQIQQFSLEEFVFTSEQLSSCTPADRHILRSFFQRYDELSTQPRAQLAFNLVDTFMNKISYEPNPPIMDSVRAAGFLASLYRDLENWAKHARM